MLLWLAQFFQDDIGAFRVFNFITFRAVFATITALSPSTSCMYTCRCADVPAAAASRCAANVRTTTMAAKDMEWSLKKGMAGRDE
jgi:hypothetical protein